MNFSYNFFIFYMRHRKIYPLTRNTGRIHRDGSSVGVGQIKRYGGFDQICRFSWIYFFWDSSANIIGLSKFCHIRLGIFYIISFKMGQYPLN